MTTDLVSVIIPCYRQARFLPATLASVLAQSYPSVQPVVVNDGSDDDTEDVARGYGDRICYVSKPNGGSNSARNAGIRAAEGKYLLFLDADDLLHRDAIAWLVEAAEGCEDRLCVMGFREFVTDPDVDGLPEFLPGPGPQLLPGLIHKNLAPPFGYLCSRRMVLEAGCFEESLHYCEEWDLWLRLALRGAEGRLVRRVGGYYRRHLGPEGSKSANGFRMTCGIGEVLHRTHALVVRDPQLWRRWGRDVGAAQHEVLGSLVRGGLRSDLPGRLFTNLGELDRMLSHPDAPAADWDRVATRREWARSYQGLGFFAARHGRLGLSYAAYNRARRLGGQQRTVLRGLLTAAPHALVYWLKAQGSRLKVGRA